MDRVDWDESNGKLMVGIGKLCNYWLHTGPWAVYSLRLEEHGKDNNHIAFSSTDMEACMQHAELIEANHLIDTMKAELSKSQRVTAIDQSFNGPDNGEVG